jgi:hypothetical protein
MKKRTVITDLENPMKDVREVLVGLGSKLSELRTSAAHLRTADQLGALATADPVVQIATVQLALDELAESLNQACARMTEARAHIAVANGAMAKVMRLMPPAPPPTPSKDMS